MEQKCRLAITATICSYHKQAFGLKHVPLFFQNLVSFDILHTNYPAGIVSPILFFQVFEIPFPKNPKLLWMQQIQVLSYRVAYKKDMRF